jgi:hypothetical protein
MSNEKQQEPVGLIEFDESEYQALRGDIKRVSLAEILKSHRRRWRLKTHIGDIILKKITHLEAEEVSIRLQTIPGYVKASVEALPWREAMRFERVLTPEEQKQMTAVGERLRPYIVEYSLKCFVDPVIKTVDEFDAILTELHPEEVAELYKILGKLASGMPDGEVEAAMLQLVKSFGIPIIEDGLDATTITSEQVVVLAQSEAKRAEQVKKEMRRP